MMAKANVTSVTDPSVGDWIRDSLGDWDEYRLAAHVPAGYETYTLLRKLDPRSFEGVPDDTSLQALINLLAAHTQTADECFHALWEGHGWMRVGANLVLASAPPRKLFRTLGLRSRRGFSVYGPGRFSAFRRRLALPRLYREAWPVPTPNPSTTLPQGAFDAPRFELPNRGYLLVRGPVGEALKLGALYGSAPDAQLHVELPNLLWPADRAWVASTEIDFDSTVIGGSKALQAALLGSAALAAEPVDRNALVADLGIAPW